MSNMSYCRFESTYRDFDECVDVVEAMMTEGGQRPLSRRELDYAKQLTTRALDLLHLVAENVGMELDDLDLPGRIDRCLDNLQSDCVDMTGRSEDA